MSASSDETCNIWDFNSGDLLATFGDIGGGSYNSVAWSPSGDKVVTGNTASDVVLWSVPSSFSSAKNIFSDVKINLLPNPANLFISVEIPSEVRQGQLEIYNQLGKLQAQYRGLSDDVLQIPIEHYPNGPYILQIQKNEKKYFGKFIKQD